MSNIDLQVAREMSKIEKRTFQKYKLIKEYEKVKYTPDLHQKGVSRILDTK